MVNSEPEHGKALHRDYLAAQEHYSAGHLTIENAGSGFSGDAIPKCVKCLHVLTAYWIAEGPGRVPFDTEPVALAAAHGNLLRTVIPADWSAYDNHNANLGEGGTRNTRVAAMDGGPNPIAHRPPTPERSLDATQLFVSVKGLLRRGSSRPERLGALNKHSSIRG